MRSLGDVARFFSAAYDTVKTWRRTGMPGSAGEWDLSAIVAWREGRQREAAGSESPHATLARVRTEREQFELERDRGDWVPIDPVCRLVTRTVNECKTRLDQLPDLLLALVPELAPSAAKDLRDRMQRTVDDLYRTLSEIRVSQELGEEPGED